MKKKNTVLALAGLLVIGGILWYSSPAGAQDKSPEAAESQDGRPVPTALVQAVPATLTREFPAKIKAGKTVKLAFSVPGLLSELNARQGREVKQGEVIARLDARDYQNALDMAEANAENNRRQYERTRKLIEQKVVAQAEYDRVKSAYDMAEAELRIRRKALEDTVLTAPFAGIIAARMVENHEHIQAKATIVSIQDISSIEVSLQIPERLVARTGPENLGNIRINIDAVEEKWLQAKILEFNTIADPITRTYELVLTLQPPKGLNVLPGMTATVRTDIASPNANTANGTSTLIPATAVITNPNGQAYVWVMNQENTPPVKTMVTTGETRQDGMVIHSGLIVGQRVITAGVHSLSTTVRVRAMRIGGEGLDG